MWLAAVPSAIASSAAIWRFVSRRATNTATCISRGVRGNTGSLARDFCCAVAKEGVEWLGRLGILDRLFQRHRPPFAPGCGERCLAKSSAQIVHMSLVYGMLGNIYYTAKNWTGTQDAWEKALALDPENALVLNNLAWHYATCEDESYQDHYRALALAKLAIRIEKAPHIWDTLAESYYVNGFYRDAVEAGRQALARAGKKRHYYEEQLEKFEAALED